MEVLKEWEGLRLRYASKLKRPASASPRVEQAAHDINELAIVRVQTAAELERIQTSERLYKEILEYQVLNKPIEEPFELIEIKNPGNHEEKDNQLGRQWNHLAELVCKQLQDGVNQLRERKSHFERVETIEFHVFLPVRPDIELLEVFQHPKEDSMSSIDRLSSHSEELKTPLIFEETLGVEFTFANQEYSPPKLPRRFLDLLQKLVDLTGKSEGFGAIQQIYDDYLMKLKWAKAYAKYTKISKLMKHWKLHSSLVKKDKLMAKATFHVKRWNKLKLSQYFSSFVSICAAHQQWISDVQTNFLCTKAETCFGRWRLYIHYKHSKRRLCLLKFKHVLKSWQSYTHAKKHQRALGYIYWYQLQTYKVFLAWTNYLKLHRRSLEQGRKALIHYFSGLKTRVFYTWLHSRALSYLDYIPVKISHSKTLVKVQGKLRECVAYDIKLMK